MNLKLLNYEISTKGNYIFRGFLPDWICDILYSERIAVICIIDTTVDFGMKLNLKPNNYGYDKTNGSRRNF